MLAAERGAAANTLSAYRRDLTDYLGALARGGHDPLAMEAAPLRAYLADLETRGLSAASAARRLSCIRGFHRFLYAEGLAEGDPSAPVGGRAGCGRCPKCSRWRRSTGCSARRARLRKGTGRKGMRGQRPGHAHALPHRAPLRTGLRVSELIALPRAAASTRERYLVVKGKGGRERLVPLTELARGAMRDHLAHGGGDGPWLFPGRQRERAPHPQAFARDLKNVAAAAGLDPDR